MNHHYVTEAPSSAWYFSRVRVVPWLLLAAAVCGCARQTQPPFDSESHWLRVCQEDDECGSLSCLCGICSTTCDDDDACAHSSEAGVCLAPAAVGVQCDDGQSSANETPICVPDCGQAVCVDGAEGEVSSVIRSNGSLLPALAPIPRCPEVAATVGLPALLAVTEVEDYEGPATVNSVAGPVVVLALNNAVNAQVQLRFHVPVPAHLSVGRRVETRVRSLSAGSESYVFLTLLDEAGDLLLAYYTGDDRLYQEGLFASDEAMGASLELSMTCQSAVEDGCFDNQVQASYQGTFRADSTVTTDGSNTPLLTIRGKPYDVSFSAGSVDGGARRAGCNPDITPGRYITFSLSPP